MTESAVIVAALFAVAVLYSSVGHGGASGYLAVMALFSIQQGVSRPTALILNICVASIATILFSRAGHFDRRIFLPFAVSSVPAAFIGGVIVLPGTAYEIILGLVLLAAAARLAWNLKDVGETSMPSWPLAIGAGASMGLVSGLVGIGGGIFLTPLLLLKRWTDAKTAAAVSAPFILVNSVAGLLGSRDQLAALPKETAFWLGSAVVGGLVGSALGAGTFSSLALRRILAAVMVIAGLKMVLA
jgi:uncharacterized membrane protein YfcA